MAIWVATAAAQLRRVLRMARLDLDQRGLDELVDQVVGLHAEALASRDFDVRPLAVLFGKLDAQIGAAARRERHHLVGEVNRLLRLRRRAQRLQSGHHHFLQIGLAHVDHVVDARSLAERRSRRRLAADRW